MAFRVVYVDIPVGMEEGATVTATNYDAISDVPEILPGVAPNKIATFEWGGWPLDGEYSLYDTEKVALWSSNLSGSNIAVSSPPVVTVNLDGLYALTAITLVFDEGSDMWCNTATVQWYNGGTLVDSVTTAPTSPIWLIERIVTGFNKIVVTCDEPIIPNRRIRLNRIVLGVYRTFTEHEILSADIHGEISMIADTIPINTLSLDLWLEQELLFQKRQTLSAYQDDTLLGRYFVASSRRTGSQRFSLSGEDLIGNLDVTGSPGGIWFTETPLTTVLTSLFGDINIFDIDPAYASETVKGFIPAGTLREVLHHIAFAIGAIVDTMGSTKIKIYPAASVVKTIPATRIYSGGSVVTTDTVTSVSVTAYTITNEAPSGNDEYVTYNGARYKCVPSVTTVNNPLALVGDIPNEKSVSGVYLVHSGNVNAVANRLMAFYQKKQTYTAKHILEGENLGDLVQVTLPWDATSEGHITTMDITVSTLMASNSKFLLTET